LRRNRALFQGVSGRAGRITGCGRNVKVRTEKTSLEDLLRELEKNDSIAYTNIDRKKPTPVSSAAIEVIRLTASRFRCNALIGWNDHSGFIESVFLFSNRSTEDLRARALTGVWTNVSPRSGGGDSGIAETRAEQNKTAMQALGYSSGC